MPDFATLLTTTLLSLAWTTWTSRRFLRRSLGRALRAGDENSIRTWMELDSASLDEASHVLERNPFDRFWSGVRIG